MNTQEVIQILKAEKERYFVAPEVNGCAMTPEWKKAIEICDICIGAIEGNKDKNPYWNNVDEMAKKQRAKGISKYGQGLEDNPMTILDRVVYLQEELIDGLMYCEHIKAYMETEPKEKPVGMTANEYQELALRTLNQQLPIEQVLVDGVLGLNGEAGECADIVKKHLFQGHNLDKEHLAKELGDTAWYLAVTAHAIDLAIAFLKENWLGGADHA